MSSSIAVEYPTEDLDELFPGYSPNPAQLSSMPPSFTSAQPPVQSRHHSSTASSICAAIGHANIDQQPFPHIVDNVPPSGLAGDGVPLGRQPHHPHDCVDSIIGSLDLNFICYGQQSTLCADNTDGNPLLDSNSVDYGQPSSSNVANNITSYPLQDPAPDDYSRLLYALSTDNASFRDPLLDLGPTDQAPLLYGHFHINTDPGLLPIPSHASYSQQWNDILLPTAVNTTNWPHCPDIGPSAPFSFATVPEPAAHFPSTTIPQLGIPDQTQVMSQPRKRTHEEFGFSSAPSLYGRAPKQPRKRLSSIAPRPLSKQLGPVNNMSITTSTPAVHAKAPFSASDTSLYSEWALDHRRSVSPYIKRKGIPEEMIDCFNFDPAKNNQTRPRRRGFKRAKFVCIRCQAKKIKCDGEFPCKNCRKCVKTMALPMEPSCIDTNVEKFNHFNVFESFYEEILPNYFDYISDMFSTARSKHNAISKATGTLLHSLSGYVHSNENEIHWGRFNTFFSYLTSTGIPAREAPTIFTSPPLTPLRITKTNLPGPPSLGFGMASFIMALTQTQTVARLAHLPERDVEIWLSIVSRILLDYTKKSLEKVRRNKETSDAEKDDLFANLVALLFASGVRSTYVLRAAQRNFDTLSSADGQRIFNGSRILCEYVLRLPDMRRYLRLWAQFWLRTLFGGSGGSVFFDMLRSVLTFCTLVFCMDFDDGVYAGEPKEDQTMKNNEEDGAEGHEVNDASEENHGDEETVEGVEPPVLAPSRTRGVERVLSNVGESLMSYSERQELQQRLDHLACQDLAGLFPPGLRLQKRYWMSTSGELNDHAVEAGMLFKACYLAGKPELTTNDHERLDALKTWIGIK